MAILPRNLLKSFFETGDKPSESQFGSLIDSMLHSTEDQPRLGLRAYDASRTYVTGEAVIHNGSLFQAIANTSGSFNPVHWQKILSLGSVSYQGTWDPVNNVPSLTSGVGTTGDYYVVSVSGTRTLDGNSTWIAGDEVIFNGTIWERVVNADLDQQTASEVSYDNTTSGLAAGNVQAALDEIDTRIEGLPWESYTSVSGETARLDSSSYTGIIPNTNSGADLGIPATRWRDLYITGNIDFSSSLAVKWATSTIATFHEEGLKVGANNGSGLPHLSVDPTGVAGKLYTMNNNSSEASVIGNYLPGSIGMSMIVTGSTYAGSGMMASSKSVLVSENHNLNIGTSTANDLGIWTSNTERLTISASGLITHNEETAFSRRTYYLNGSVDTEIDWARSNTFHKRLESDIIFTFANEVDLQTIVVGIEQGGSGSYNITWPAGIHWPNGVAPTPTPTSGKTDVYTFVRMNGVIYGNVVQNF